jgi:hypothetical protein
MTILFMLRLMRQCRHAAAAVAISLVTAGGITLAQPATQPGGDGEPRASESDQDEQPEPDPAREPRRDRERRQGDQPGHGRGDQPPRPVDRIPRDGRPGQPGPGGGFPGGPFRPFPDPLREALDSNRDGSLDADEIAAAAESLKTLDKDGDGSLSGEELRPALPGPFGPGAGFGGQGRGPDQGFPGGPFPGGPVPPAATDGPDPRRRGGDRPDYRGDQEQRGSRDDDRPRSRGDGPRDEQPDGDRPSGRPGFGNDPGSGRGPGFGGGQVPGGPGGPQPGGPFGGRPSPDVFADRLMEFDEDGDGMLSRDEVTAFAEDFLQRIPAFNSPGMPGGQPFQGQRPRQGFQGPGGQGFPRRPPPADGSPRNSRPQRPEADGE